MENTPLVSVIIPTHNRPKMLRQAVDSVLNQTYENIEIIIVDNASKEPAMCTIMNHLSHDKNGQIKIKRLDVVHESPSMLYNAGFALSMGSIIAFLDDDNVYTPNRIEDCVKELDTTDCVYTSMQILAPSDSNDPLFVEKPARLSGITERDWPIEAIHTNDLVVKRQVIDNAGAFDEILHSSIGMELLIRMQRCGYKARYLPQASVLYRLWDGQRSARSDYKDKDSEARAYIANKEALMRKRLKVLSFAGHGEVPDPFFSSGIKDISWLSMSTIDLPSIGIKNAITMSRPNYLLVQDLAHITPQEREILTHAPIVSVGVATGACTRDDVEHYPFIDWLVTDNSEHISARPRVILAEPPMLSDNSSTWMWTHIMNTVRCNRYIG